MTKKTVIVFDVIVTKNIFCLIAKNTDTNQYCTIEISERKNNINLIYKLFDNKNYIFVTYNGIHFSNSIVNYILNIRKSIENSSVDVLIDGINYTTKIIIEEDFQQWIDLKYAKNFMFIDLITMLFKEKKRIGLNEMKVLLHIDNVNSNNYNYKSKVKPEDYDNVILSCKERVDAIECIVNKCIEEINFRVYVSDLYGTDMLSKNSIAIGAEILKINYLKQTHSKWDEIKNNKDYCDNIQLKDILLPIRFDTKCFNDLVDELNTVSVQNTKKAYSKKLLIDNIEVDFSVGGLHSINKPEIIEPKQGEVLLDSDSDSFYGSIIAQYQFYPPHLGEGFGVIYERLLNERLKAKAIDENSVKSRIFKLALAGAIGNFNNEHSWMYSPKTAMAVRINGQLLILKLAELLIKYGCVIKVINTDGITYISKGGHNNALREWAKITGLSITTKQYDKIYQLDVNNFIALGEKNKLRGQFDYEFSFDKKNITTIIAKAVYEYFVNNIPVKDTITNCKDVREFVLYSKFDNKYKIEYKNSFIGNINRYYVSNDMKKSGYLYKCIVYDEEIKEQSIIINKPVILINTFPKEFPKDIDYNYYIAQAQKVINKFEQKQLSLFDLFE